MTIDAIRNKFYDSTRVDWNNLMFSTGDIWKLLIPLMVEQLLTSFMGMADSIMVTRVGSAAIAAVSLTDSINNLVIQMFAALATGGTIVCSQYIGSGSPGKSNQAARQVVLSVLTIAVVVCFLSEMFRYQILRLVFGTVEDDVMEAAATYFLYTAASFPFLGLFQAGSAFYRAGGNSRFPMLISILSNIMNIIGNAIFIFVFRWGVAGAALSTLLSRIFSAVVIYVFLRLPRQPIVIDHYLQIRPNFDLIRKVLFIGIPSGIENSMFQFGKLAIQSSVSTLGTKAIAAQAMAIIFENVNGIGGIAIGTGLMTIVGQCLGAGRREEAKYYITRLTEYSWAVLAVSCLVTFLIGKPVMNLAGLEPESAALCYRMLIFISAVKPLIWVFSFIPPYGMRAAGDVKYAMIVASLSMWLCRVAMTTFLIRVMGFGPIAVWIGMASDWAVRGVIFMRRYFSGKWLQHEVI